MFISSWATLLISLLFIHINADVNKPQHVLLNTIEHQSTDMNGNKLSNESDNSLIRIHRIENYFKNNRQRRGVYDEYVCFVKDLVLCFIYL